MFKKIRPIISERPSPQTQQPAATVLTETAGVNTGTAARLLMDFDNDKHYFYRQYSNPVVKSQLEVIAC